MLTWGRGPSSLRLVLPVTHPPHGLLSVHSPPNPLLYVWLQRLLVLTSEQLVLDRGELHRLAFHHQTKWKKALYT